MEKNEMGKLLVIAKIESLKDLHFAEKGDLSADDVRAVEVTDALVDTGAPGLGMPKRLIDQLGLKPVRQRRARTTAGLTTVQIYDAVRLTIQERECFSDVTELPDDSPVLIGQIPLEILDFVVDPVNQRLIGNPAHGGEQMIELY